MVDQVGADGVMEVELEGDLELGADAVCGGDEDGLRKFFEVEREEAAEAPISESTCLLNVLRASILMRCLARSPAVMSTPASA